MKKILFGLLALTISVTIACQKKNDSAPVAQKVTCENGQVKEVGIFGGETLNSDSTLAKGMVLVYRSMGDQGGSFCTGTLIDTNIILTAAHCVPALGANPETVSVYWSVDPICSVVQNGDQSLIRVADEISVHKSYYLSGLGLGKERGDIAMIRIKDIAPVEMVPAKLVKKSLKLTESSKILVAGFGKTTDYTTEDTEKQLMRFALVKPYFESSQTATGVTVKSTVKNGEGGKDKDKDKSKPVKTSKDTTDLKREHLYLDQTQGQGACAGDSGGPAMIQANDDSWSVIGVASFVAPLQTDEFKDQRTTCRQGVAYSSVVYFKEWIAKTYENLKNEKSLNGLQWVEFSTSN